MNVEPEKLIEIEKDLLAQRDAVYRERDKCVALVAKMAIALGCKAGIGGHDVDDLDWDPEWRTIIYVDLPAGQVSWHVHQDEAPLFAFLPPYDGKWDGHSTEEKYMRVIEPGDFGEDQV